MTDVAKAWWPHLYTPKLVTTFVDGYGLADLRRDAVAGLTVAVVALPLSMAIAIGSGVSPGQGLITSVVGGLLVSALGGSRFQIGGPAGAFIVLVATTVAKFGVDGLALRFKLHRGHAAKQFLELSVMQPHPPLGVDHFIEPAAIHVIF